METRLGYEIDRKGVAQEGEKEYHQERGVFYGHNKFTASTVYGIVEGLLDAVRPEQRRMDVMAIMVEPIIVFRRVCTASMLFFSLSYFVKN